jgi:hypothetical protein
MLSRLARSYLQARSSHLRAAIASSHPSAASAGPIRCRRRGSTVPARALATKLVALSGSVETRALAVRSANSSSVTRGAHPHINHPETLVQFPRFQATRSRRTYSPERGRFLMIVSKDRRALTAERLPNPEERRAAPSCQLAGSGSLDAAIVRLRSTAVLQVPRSVGGSEITGCRAVGLTR